MSIEKRCQTRRFPPSSLAPTHRLERALSRRWASMNTDKSCKAGSGLVEILNMPHYAPGVVLANRVVLWLLFSFFFC
jgi:hypothetical protein